MTAIIDFDARYVLGVEVMDDTHRAFIDLVNRLAASDKTSFAGLFGELVAHTREHFAAEEQLMEQCRFPAIGEHRSKHHRVLGELERFADQVEGGRTRLARAYVAGQIPRWLALHAATMDSALAAQLRRSAAVDMPALAARPQPGPPSS